MNFSKRIQTAGEELGIFFHPILIEVVMIGDPIIFVGFYDRNRRLSGHDQRGKSNILIRSCLCDITLSGGPLFHFLALFSRQPVGQMPGVNHTGDDENDGR